jgi:hypothetical protein
MKISLTELREILATAEERDMLKAQNAALTVERDGLKAEVMALVAHDAKLAAQVNAAFETSEALESKLRGIRPAS